MRIFKGFGCRSEVLIFKEFRFCKFGFQHLQGHLRLGSTGLEQFQGFKRFSGGSDLDIFCSTCRLGSSLFSRLHWQVGKGSFAANLKN